VECALKACIAKQIRSHEVPDKALIDGFYVHHLDRLLGLSGLRPELEQELRTNGDLSDNWAVVKGWKVESRYELGTSDKLARGMYLAVTDSANGVLVWLKKWW